MSRKWLESWERAGWRFPESSWKREEVGVAHSRGWDEAEEAVNQLGPAAKTARLPMRSPGTVCKGRGEVLFYNSNTTDDSISSQGAGMYTGYRVGSILSFRPPGLICLRVWVSWSSTYLSGTTPGNRLEVSSSPPGSLFSLHLNPMFVLWVCKPGRCSG